MKHSKYTLSAISLALAVLSVVAIAGGALKTLDLLPRIPGWSFSEEPKLYGPESLFEYIDGAAEAFINYDMIDAAVGQFKQDGGKATLSVDVYDMGRPLNAFGIYTTERFAESRFLPIGVQGYLEEGTLNFLAGKYYVKLMAYDAGEKTEPVLRAFAAEILRKIGDPGAFPAVLKAFPAEGRIANSEKFILKSFLGLEFMKNGLVASYKTAGGAFDAFIIETASEGEAATLLKRYLAKAAVSPTSSPAKFKDPYLDNMTVGQSGRFLFGTMKVKDADKAAGDQTAAGLEAGLAGK